jgi:phage gp16-like protein
VGVKALPEVDGSIAGVSRHFFNHVEVVLFDLAPLAQDDLAVLEDVHVVAGLKRGTSKVECFQICNN